MFQGQNPAGENSQTFSWLILFSRGLFPDMEQKVMKSNIPYSELLVACFHFTVFPVGICVPFTSYRILSESVAVY